MIPHSERLNPLLAALSSRVLGRQGPVDVEVLQPEEIEAVRPVAMLDGQIERVSGTDEHARLRYHLDAVVATELRHAPVVRKRVRKALIGRDGMATPRFKMQYDSRLLGEAWSGPIKRLSKVRYCQDYVSWRYFGHWLTDALPSALIDGPEDGALWMPGKPDWSHCEDYKAMFGLTTLAPRLTYAEDLVFYQDFGQGSHKRRRYAQLREGLQARFGGRSRAELVFISRGSTGVARRIADEQRLIDRVRARGWAVVDIANVSAAQLQEAICNARVVVSMDGSHFDHAHLGFRPGGAMIVLNPHDRFTSRQLMVCPANDVRAGCVVLKGAEGGGYRVEWSEVERTVDLALSDAAQGR